MLISIGNINNLVPNFFHKENWVLHCENLQRYWRLGSKKKKKKDYRLTNNVVSGKAMENLRGIVNVRPVNNKKSYLRWTSKPNYV